MSKRLIALAGLGLLLFGPGSAFAQATPAPAPLTDEEELALEKREKVWLGLGGRVRFLTIPKAVYEALFSLDHAVTTNFIGFGAQFIRRKDNLDIEIAVEYIKLAPADALWLEAGDNPGNFSEGPSLEHIDYNAVGISATFLWHANLTDWMQLRYGAGIGALIGVGEWTKTRTHCESNTTIADLDDPTTGKCRPDGSTTQDRNIPPMLPLINLVAGLRFKLAEQFSITIEGGLQDFIFVGTSFGYFF